jgi:hypothetical protein
MEISRLQFDGSRASEYRKVSRVLAFRSDDAFEFRKPWGVQKCPEGSWIIIPLLDGGATGDLYGCHREAFVATYRAAVGDSPHCYEKHATVRAYQPGEPFAEITEDAGFEETNPATGGATDWLVQNPAGEVYIVSDAVFRRTYRPAA